MTVFHTIVYIMDRVRVGKLFSILQQIHQITSQSVTQRWSKTRKISFVNNLTVRIYGYKVKKTGWDSSPTLVDLFQHWTVLQMYTSKVYTFKESTKLQKIKPVIVPATNIQSSLFHILYLLILQLTTIYMQPENQYSKWFPSNRHISVE
jgi:RIO-like serine/threonine protein kinase